MRPCCSKPRMDVSSVLRGLPRSTGRSHGRAIAGARTGDSPPPPGACSCSTLPAAELATIAGKSARSAASAPAARHVGGDGDVAVIVLGDPIVETDRRDDARPPRAPPRRRRAWR